MKHLRSADPGRDFILDYCLCMSVYWASTGPIISSLTKFFGLSLAASNFISGFATILPIFQLVGGMAYSASKNHFRFVRLTGSLWRVFMPLVFLSVLLPRGIGRWVMVSCYLAGMVIYQYSFPPLISWMSGCVESMDTDNYYARREARFMAAYTALFCFVTLTIDLSQRWGAQKEGFVLVGIVFTVLLLASLWVLLRLPAPVIKPEKNQALTGLLIPLRDRRFRPLIYATICWNFCLMFITGFTPVYQVQVLNVSFFQIMLFITMANTLRTFVTPVMGRLALRIGWVKVTSLCTCIILLIAVLWGFTTKENYLWRYPMLVILEGLAFSGLSVGHLELHIANSPSENRSIYVGLINLVAGASSLVGSLACSTLISVLERYSYSAIRCIFFVGAAFCGLCLVLLQRVSCNRR